MIEILSLPRRPKEMVANPLKSMAKAGLPINSLPGWEHIPLNSKLPMLKCPGNQVIFTKNKIGKSILSNRQMKNQFDPSGRDKYPEYNALHDSHLRNFYANERNLKRLRTNGEITDQNDVICNLKDFNEYRQQLNKSQLHVILQQMNRLEEEQHDRMLITNAESIAARDQSKQTGRGQGYKQVLERKALWDKKKKEKALKLWERNEQRFASIKAAEAQLLAANKEKIIQHQLEMRKHWDMRHDIQRRKLILLKKAFHLKTDRMRKNLRRLKYKQEKKSNEQQSASWNKRLRERIQNEDRMQMLLRQVEKQRVEFIQEHIATYKSKWEKIEQEIKERVARNKAGKGSGKGKSDKDLSNQAGRRRSSCTEYLGSFENLLDEEICMALSATLDLTENTVVPFDADDPIYKAAQYIMQHIVRDFHKDLSCDEVAYTNVYRRIESFFTDAKKFIIFRATQIISAARDNIKEGPGVHRPIGKPASMSRVSFSRLSSTIGISSYEIHPLIEVKDVNNRMPTPAGSLDSTVVNSATSLVKKNPSGRLCRNEMIFLEHFVIKFKRQVLVGVGKRVFAAIQCHFHDKTMNVRQEVLDLDRKFLINQVTKSILSYSVNPLNFESMLRLSISFLTNDITWSLQQVLLKPYRDARRIAKPNLRHNCLKGEAKGMCLFCNS